MLAYVKSQFASEGTKLDVDVLGERCIQGITANPDRMRDSVLQSASIATALNPILGYEASTALVAPHDSLCSEQPLKLRICSIVSCYLEKRAGRSFCPP